MATGNLTDGEDYFEATQLALQAGLPTEAKLFMDKGFETKALGQGKDADRHGRMLKGLLAQATKKADFGKAERVVLIARLVEFTAEQRGDVLRLSCTIVGRVDGGPGARSRISYGGSPAKRAELEKQVLTMVANGVVARLAEIARTRAATRND